VDKERAFVAAVASGRQTDAANLALPQPGELDDMGLSRISKTMTLDPSAVDRHLLLRHLGLGLGQRRYVDVPGPIGRVRLDEYAVCT
jgi:hypothetical protein